MTQTHAAVEGSVPDPRAAAPEEPLLLVTPELRVSAYAVCIQNSRILLARFAGLGREWTLPGGGLEHGEDPYDAVLREAEEETGYQIEVDRLLGMDTKHRHYPRGPGAATDFHGLRIVYTAHVVSGDLRPEIGGSTNHAEWIDLDRVGTLPTVDLVETALRLCRTRPPTGRLVPR